MCLFFISFFKLLGRKGTQSVLFALTESTLVDKHREKVLVRVFIPEYSSEVKQTARAVTTQACCLWASFSHDPTGALMAGTGPAGRQEDVPGTRRPGGPAHCASGLLCLQGWGPAKSLGDGHLCHNSHSPLRQRQQACGTGPRAGPLPCLHHLPCALAG